MSLKDAVIAVTGATGLVGAECCRELTARGAIVRALVRDPEKQRDPLSPIARGGVFKFELGGALDADALKQPVRALIHCAYIIQSGPREQVWRCNVDGSRRLFDAAHEAGIEQIIFISSIAAHEEARSQYGRGKWLLENEIDSRKGTSIKPGTIVGPGGVFARVRALVARMPAVPIFYASHPIQTVLIDDVIEAVIQAAERRLAGRFVVAEPQGVLQADFYRGIAVLEGKRPLLARFPGNLALALALAGETVGLRLPITSDNIRGIRHVRHFDTEPSNATLQLHPRDFWASILEMARREGKKNAIERVESLARGNRR